MPWIVKWQGAAESCGPFATEWEAVRFGCMESRKGRRGGFQVVDLAPPADLMHVMLEPDLAGAYWGAVAKYLQPTCDRFWIHWGFRPPNDPRSIWDQLLDPAGAPPVEPLPPRETFALKRLDPFIEGLEHSWICPNGAAATGTLPPEVLGLLVAREEIRWWDLHLCSQGRIRLVATDGGCEYFAWVSCEDINHMTSSGVPATIFRRL